MQRKTKEILTEIDISDQSENSIYNIVNKIENIFINTADTCKTRCQKPQSESQTQRRKTHKPWYNKDCKGLKRQLNKRITIQK